MINVTLRVTLLTLLLLLAVTSTWTVYFENGYDHHYTYASDSEIFGVHNVTTIIKVG